MAISLHYAGIIPLEELALMRYEEAYVHSGAGSMQRETVPAGTMFWVLAPMLRRQMANPAEYNVEAPNAHSPQPQPQQWKRSLTQTAIILRLATLSSSEYMDSGGGMFDAPLNDSDVSKLESEFIMGVGSAFASGLAVGKPVDMLQLMAWIGPLMYR